MTGTPEPAAAPSSPPPADTAASAASVPAAPVPAPAAYDWGAVLGDQRATYEPLIQAKGWRTPAEALTGYANLEKLVGVAKVALPPKDAKPEEWEAFYGQIGRPDKPDAYDLKRPDAIPEPVYNVELERDFRAAAHKAGLTAQQAASLHQWWTGNVASQQQRAQAGGGAATDQQIEVELRKEFGAAYDQRIELAKRAARQFGAEPEVLDALEAKVGGAALIKMFARIGVATAEDTLAGDGPRGFTRTPADALAALERLKLDTDFSQALLNPRHPAHDDAVRRRDDMFRLAYPGA